MKSTFIKRKKFKYMKLNQKNRNRLAKTMKIHKMKMDASKLPSFKKYKPRLI